MLKDALAVTKSRHHLILLQFDIYTHAHAHKTTANNAVSQFRLIMGNVLLRAVTTHMRQYKFRFI